MNYNYLEYITGGFTHSKGNNDCIVTMQDVKDYEGKTDCFISAFRFPAEFKEYFKQFKTVSGYGGKFTFETILMDFDCTGDIPKAKQELEKFLEYGLQEFLDFEEIENHVKIAFSGNKGFSLGIPAGFLGTINPDAENNNYVKAFVKRLTEIASDTSGIEFQTVDFAIYDKVRLFRLPNTINSKSGLYKIPLLYSELLNMDADEITALAKSMRKVSYKPMSDIKVNEPMRDIFRSIIQDANNKTNKPAMQEPTENTVYNFSSVSEGMRNETIFNNANYLRYKNVPMEATEQILIQYNSSLSEPLSKSELKTIIKSAYRYETKEQVKENIVEYQDFETRLNHYAEYVKNIQRKKVKIGFPIIDDALRGLRPGNVLTLLAGTGIGKSMIAQNILQNYAKKTNELTIFFSLEMAIEEIFERELQMEFDITGYEVENSFLQDAETIKQRCKTIVNTQNNIITVIKRIDVINITNYIRQIENITGKKAGLVCIDYLALVKNRQFEREEYLRITDNMQKLKEYAKILEIPFIVLSQVARSEIKSNEGISLFSGKGSGEVENSSDIILSLEKSKEHPSKDNIDYLILSILKNRRGGYAKIIIEFNRCNLRMTESTLNYETENVQAEKTKEVDITF